MKREHKLLSVGVAVLILLLIAYAYNHSTKEGMSNKNNRRGASGVTTPAGPPSTIIEHIIEFLKFRWLLEMLGLAEPRSNPLAPLSPQALQRQRQAERALSQARANRDRGSIRLGEASGPRGPQGRVLPGDEGKRQEALSLLRKTQANARRR